MDCFYCITDRCACNTNQHGTKICVNSQYGTAITQVAGTAVCRNCAVEIPWSLPLDFIRKFAAPGGKS